MRPSIRARHATHAAGFAAMALIVAALSGCAAEAPDAVITPGPASTTGPSASPEPRADDLAARAERAIADNRLFAPAGDNAIEHYLAQDEQHAGRGSDAEAALIELQPYAMIAAEQAIAAGDLVEAERLVALIARIDAAAPSLARLRGDIEAARQAPPETDTQDTAEPASVASTPATTARATLTNAQRAPQAAAAPPPAATPPPARRTLPTAAAPTSGAATREPASAATNQASPTTTTAATAGPSPATPPAPLVAVSTPFPRFPSEAIARGRSVGSVTVRFTVRTNGRVGDVQVITARPEGLFDRTVVETLGEWRFEPIDRDQVQTRTFDFRN